MTITAKEIGTARNPEELEELYYLGWVAHIEDQTCPSCPLMAEGWLDRDVTLYAARSPRSPQIVQGAVQ